MSRDVKYYNDFRRNTYDVGHYRYRWILTPPYLATLTLGAAPAWGAGPLTGYTQIPSGVLYASGELEEAYEDRPHGIPDASGFKQGANVGALWDSGDSELVSLGDYLLSPTYYGVDLEIPIDGGDPLLLGEIDVSLVWELYTDDGDSEKSVADFRRCFVGGIRDHTQRTLQARSAEREVGFDFELVHLGKLVLEKVTAAFLRDYFLSAYGDTSGAFGPDDTDGAASVFYDELYRDAGRNFARCHRRHGPGFDKGRWYRLVHLFTTMRIVADAVYCRFMRIDQDLAAPRFRLHSRTNLSSGTATVQDDGTPYDHITFYERSLTKANVTGAQLAREAVYFLGTIWNDSSGGSDQSWHDAYVNGRFKGGFLIHHSQASSIFAKEIANGWDFLKRCTRGVCRASWALDVTDDGPGMVLRFDQLNDSLPLTLTRRDIAKGDTEYINITLNAQAVTSCTIAVMDSTGDDLSSTTFPHVTASKATLAEPAEKGTLVLHNWPTLGESANRYQMYGTTVAGASDVANPDIYTPFTIAASTGFPTLTLCYFATPTDISRNEVPIRVADQVRLHLDGEGVIGGGGFGYVDGEVTELPAPSGDVVPDLFDDLFWLPMKAAMRNTQTFSGLAYSLAARLTAVYGSTNQCGVNEPISFGALFLYGPGERFDLRDDLGTLVGLAAFVASGQDRFSALAKRGHVVRTKFNVDDGTAEADMIFTP